MQDEVRRAAYPAARIERADIALNEAKVAPLTFGDGVLHLCQVAWTSSGEIVQAGHLLVQPEQRLQEIGTDKSGDTRNEPGAGAGPDALFHLFVHHSRSALSRFRPLQHPAHGSRR